MTGTIFALSLRRRTARQLAAMCRNCLIRPKAAGRSGLKPLSAFLGALALALLAAPATASTTTTVSDDFNDNSTDTSLWDVVSLGSGDSGVLEQNGRLEMRLGADASGGDSGFGVGYVTKHTVPGDFDVQMSFSLLNWPSNSGARLGVGLSDVGAGVVERLSLSPTDYFPRTGDFYVTQFGDGVQGFVSTPDLSGGLRFTRVGATMSGYYWDGADWTLIHQGPGPAHPSHISISLWSDNQVFADLEVAAALDDFHLTFSDVPEPSQDMVVGGCFIAALLWRQRRRR
jgi:hypothetical protein